MGFDCPEVKEAEKELRGVISALERNGGSGAEALRALLADITEGNSFAAKEAFLKTGGMCHPKCLGDQFLKDISMDEWLGMLEKLELACAAAFKRLKG